MEEKIIFFVEADFPTYRTISKCETFTEAINLRHEKIDEGAVSIYVHKEIVKTSY